MLTEQLVLMGAAGLGLGVICWIAYSLHQLLKTITDRVPSSRLLEEVSATSKALSVSVNSHAAVVAQLPQTVSESVANEVNAGVGNLTTTLGQAISALDNDGNLGQWLEELRATVAPIQQVAERIDQQLTITHEILKTTHKLTHEAAGQSNATGATLKKFEELLNRWTSEETLNWRAMEHRIEDLSWLLSSSAPQKSSILSPPRGCRPR